jgi:hypothetical protein
MILVTVDFDLNLFIIAASCSSVGTPISLKISRVINSSSFARPSSSAAFYVSTPKGTTLFSRHFLLFCSDPTAFIMIA